MTYSVKEIIFDDFTNSVDTFYYELKEVYDSKFLDNLNRESIKIDRYKRNNSNELWKYQNTWYSTNDNSKAERVENNKRYVKLSFPISIDAVWNLNSLNIDNAINVYYGFIHRKFQLDAFKFDSAVSVESPSINNTYSERKYREIYAKNIGLVYKNQISIEKDGASTKRGFIIEYRLKEYE